MSQLAKLFIRGKLVNQIAKNLSKQESEKVISLMDKAWNDPSLSNAKHEFCLALKRTIKNEYNDKEVGMNDARITFWRTAVDILYGEHEDDNRWSIETIDKDSEKIKKIFQTWLFNYLKQIIRENKRPSKEYKVELEGSADKIAVEFIKSVINNNPKYIEFHVEENDNFYNIIIENTKIPPKVIDDIKTIADEFKECNVNIHVNSQEIIVSKGSEKILNKKVSKRVLIHIGSINIATKDDEENNIENYYKSDIHKKEMSSIMSKDIISTIKDKLSNKAQKVVEIIISPPEEFSNQYKYTHKKNIADFLGHNKSDMKRIINEIKECCKHLELCD